MDKSECGLVPVILSCRGFESADLSLVLVPVLSIYKGFVRLLSLFRVFKAQFHQTHFQAFVRVLFDVTTKAPGPCAVANKALCSQKKLLARQRNLDSLRRGNLASDRGRLSRPLVELRVIGIHFRFPTTNCLHGVAAGPIGDEGIFVGSPTAILPPFSNLHVMLL